MVLPRENSDSDTIYTQVQLGYEPLAFLFLLGFFTLNTEQPIWLLGLIILLSIAVIVCRLVIKIDRKYIYWYFGPWVFRRQIPLDAIKSAQHSKKPWLSGYGIRETSRGKLYTVSGRSVIDIELSDGSHILLGCRDGDALLQVIQCMKASNPK